MLSLSLFRSRRDLEGALPAHRGCLSYEQGTPVHGGRVGCDVNCCKGAINAGIESEFHQVFWYQVSYEQGTLWPSSGRDATLRAACLPTEGLGFRLLGTCTLHPALYALHPTPYAYALHPTPYTLHPTP
jgi:hypothetical protein